MRPCGSKLSYSLQTSFKVVNCWFDGSSCIFSFEVGGWELGMNDFIHRICTWKWTLRTCESRVSNTLLIRFHRRAFFTTTHSCSSDYYVRGNLERSLTDHGIIFQHLMPSHLTGSAATLGGQPPSYCKVSRVGLEISAKNDKFMPADLFPVIPMNIFRK